MRCWCCRGEIEPAFDTVTFWRSSRATAPCGLNERPGSTPAYAHRQCYLDMTWLRTMFAYRRGLATPYAEVLACAQTHARRTP